MPKYSTLKALQYDSHGGFYYLSSPYSHPDKDIRAERARECYSIHAYLLSRGIFSCSPIYSAHAASIDYTLPKDRTFWWNFNVAFMRPAVGLLIAPIPGYLTSKGIAAEVAFGRENAKPIYILNIPCDCARLLEAGEELSQLD